MTLKLAKRNATHLSSASAKQRVGLFTTSPSSRARGCVANTFPVFLRKIGLNAQQTNSLIRKVAFTTSRCTFALFCASHHKLWSQHELLGGSEHKAEC